MTLDQAAAGDGQLVVLEGAAGVGKSSLLRAAIDLARKRGLTVLAATGDEFEMDFGWGVVLQLLERAIRQEDARGRAELLRGPAGHAEALLCGGHGYGDLDGTDGADSSDEAVDSAEVDGSAHETPAETWDVPPAAMRHALHWVVANLATRGPLLVTVDDLQWGDPPSVAFVAYLARRVHDLPIVLLVSSRSGVANETSRARERLAREPGAHHLVPPRLTTTGATELVRSRRPRTSDDVCAAVYDATGGNPFLVGVAVTILEGAGEVPDALLTARLAEFTTQGLRFEIGEHLRHFDPTVVAIARAIAVVGPSVNWSVAAAVSGVTRADARRAVQVLEADEWLHAGTAAAHESLPAATDDWPISFHPLIRSAMVSTIAEDDLADLHAQAQRELAARGVASEHLAVHAMACRPAGSADTTAVLVRAARRARQSGAADLALDLLRRAAHEPPPPAHRAEVLSLLARTAGVVGAPDLPARFDDAIEATADERTASGLSLQAGQALVAQRRYHEASAYFDRAVAADDGCDPSFSAELRAARLAALRFDDRRRAEWKTQIDRLTAADIAGASFAGRALAAEIAYSCGISGTDLKRARAFALTAVDGDIGVELAFANPFGWGTAMHALHQVNEYARAAAVAEAVATKAKRRGSAHTYGMAMTYLALMQLRLGRLPDALATHGALASSMHANPPFFVPLNAADLSLTYLGLGQIDEAEATMRELAGSTYQGDLFESAIPEAQAWIQLARQDAVGAVDTLAPIGLDRAEKFSFPPSTTTCRTVLARARMASGDVAGAISVSDVELQLARAWGAPRALGIALTTAGIVRPGTAGLAYFDEAVAVLTPSEDVLHGAWALTERGSRRREMGRTPAARTDLRDALAVAVEPTHSAGLLERRVVEELGRAGARTTRRAVSGVRSLTPTELLVARAASGQKSNSEIAAELFVSRKAIEFHLSNAYRKLEIRGRRELAKALDAD